MRGSRALVIWPKFRDSSASETPGPPADRLGGVTPARKLLVRLNASPRTCTLCRSVIRKFRVRARSNCQKLGPGTLLRFMVLKVPKAGSANAAGLIQHEDVGWEQSVFWHHLPRPLTIY